MLRFGFGLLLRFVFVLLLPTHFSAAPRVRAVASGPHFVVMCFGFVLLLPPHFVVLRFGLVLFLVPSFVVLRSG